MIFKKKSIYKSVVKYECWDNSCKARINLLPDGLCVLAKNYSNHNHETHEDKFKELKALNEIKNDCLDAAGLLGGGSSSAVGGIRNVFQRVCERHQEETENISFSKIQRGLQYLVSKNMITSPTTPLQVIEGFQLETIWSNFGLSKDEANPRPFYTGCFVEDNMAFCLFSSLKSIDLIKENIPEGCRKLLMDATFKIVPQGCFKQLLIIYVEYFNKIFPIFFILMEKKTKQSYIYVLQYIKENIFDLAPSVFITDYETGMRQAVRAIFPQATNIGCWFHYCQAIRRNVSRRMTLLRFIRSTRGASIEYKKIMALPLLPASHIPGAYQHIRSTIALMDSTGSFSSFLKYFETQWMKKVGFENFSVHGQSTRTTSAIEAYNGVLGRQADKNGNFFKFVKVLRNEEFFKARSFEMLANSGGSTAVKKRKVYADRDTKIEEANLLLQQGKITAATFLSRMVFGENDVCNDMIPKDDDFEEVETSHEESEDENDNNQTAGPSNSEHLIDSELFVVCQDLQPSIVFLPCRHLKVCRECHLRLMADALANGNESYRCPCCRQNVEDNIEVFK